MSQCYFIHNFFQDGYLDTLAEVRLLQQAGKWTKRQRASWLKQAVTSREELIHHRHSAYPMARSYYAGRIAALKSRVTASFSKRPQVEKNLALLSHVEAHRQERYREAMVYTTVSGWDWEKDEEEELDLIEREMTFSLLSSSERTLNFLFTWMLCSLFFLALLPIVSVYQFLCVLMTSALLAEKFERKASGEEGKLP